MASKLGLMKKQEAVDGRLRSATNRLQARGVDVGSFPDHGRDHDLKQYQRTEHTANLLEACCDRIDELGDQVKAAPSEKIEELKRELKAEKKSVAELTGGMEAATARIAELEALVAAKAADEGDAKPDADPSHDAASADGDVAGASVDSAPKDAPAVETAPKASGAKAKGTDKP